MGSNFKQTVALFGFAWFYDIDSICKVDYSNLCPNGFNPIFLPTFAPDLHQR